MPKPLTKSTSKRVITVAPSVAAVPAAAVIQHKITEKPKASNAEHSVTPTAVLAKEDEKCRTLRLRSTAPLVTVKALIQEFAPHGTVEVISYVPGDAGWPWRVRYETSVEARRARVGLRSPGNKWRCAEGTAANTDPPHKKTKQ
jgi:hypothetical protein